MIDLKAIAKDAADRVHKNGGCVPQMAFAPILFALQDALSTPPRPSRGPGRRGVIGLGPAAELFWRAWIVRRHEAR